MKYTKRCIICDKEFTTTSTTKVVCNEIHYRKCEICGAEFILPARTPDRTTCSKRCTFMKNYGVPSPFMSEAVKAKSRETSMRKYGTASPLSSDVVKNKIKETNKKKYGCDNPMKSEEIKAKARATNQDRYGVDYPMQSTEVQEKSRQTLLDKYGVDNISKLPETWDKTHETWMKNYGVSHPLKSSVVQDKAVQTNLAKYGVGHFTQSDEYKIKTSETCMDKYGVAYPCMTDQCIQASSRISKVNRKFMEFLNDHGIDAEYEYRLGRFSYDLHVLNTDILIEIDPTFTHKITTPHHDYMIDKSYHLSKTFIAKENGFRCIHIFDWDDWNKILDVINPNKHKVYARKCQIVKISSAECDEFMNKYHLQNTCRGQSVRLGLMYNDELIQVMTFGKPRYNKNYEYELLRLCTKSGYSVVGGSNKLFSYFIRNYNPRSIISYCDNAKFTGDAYDSLGMTLKSLSDIGIHWYHNGIHITDNLLGQQGFDRLLGDKYGTYGKGTNNEELMKMHGFVQVPDCGQKVFVWSNENNLNESTCGGSDDGSN